LCYDAGSVKSFRGIPGTNLAKTPTSSFSTTLYDTTYRKTKGGRETVNVPTLGAVSAATTYIYNDYINETTTPGGCCPNLFYYHVGGAPVVSPSTTYTYAIVYKTLSGYTHPNFLYRYEYNASGVYVGEAGIHNTANRISLGDGWWYAWGQFTTSATTTALNLYSFYYQYRVHDTMYVANISLTAGTYIFPPQQIVPPGTTRGATVATGGGVLDLSGRGSGAELVNTPSFSTSSLGSFSFNGTNQIIIAPENSALNTQSPTVEVWVKTNNTTQNGFFFEKGNVNTQYSLFQENATIVWRTMGLSNQSMYATTATYMSTSSWAHVVGTYSGGVKTIYINGVPVTSASGVTGTIETNANGISIGAYGGYNGGRSYYYNGEIGMVKVYDRVLTPAEVLQNYNAGKGRYGL